MKWLLELERKLPSKALRWITFALLLVLILAIPVYAGVGDISVKQQTVQVGAPAVTQQSASDLDSRLASFYQILFAAMAMVLGLVVALAYLTIRAVSRDTLIETVQKEVDKYFTRDKPFLDGLEDNIELFVGNQLPEYVSGMQERIEQIESRISALERSTSNRHEDDEGSGGEKTVEAGVPKE